MTIPVKSRAKLSKFEAARANLETFEKEHARTIEDYNMLREAYNAALEEVKATFKEHHEEIGKTFGDFSIRTKTLVDARKLLELLGPDEGSNFIELEHKVLKAAYTKAVKDGDIPQEIAEQVESPGPVSVYGPKKV